MRIGVWIADRFFSGVGMGWLNKLLGLVFGLSKALLLVGLLLYLVQKFDSKETLIQKETKENSILFSPINRFVTTVFPSLIHFVDVSLDASTDE
jgi:membrane protein required for colicin V production